ncbi:MAG: alpha/beta hydrolase [Sphaerochaetaceae bacterium]|nr:alpha/beta hydrolase [Sphaerochaetaceae bacterium]
MIYETVRIGSSNLTLYCISNSKEMNPNRRRPLVLICPGGGYEYVSDREAEPIALRFLSYGFHAAVLRYTCNTHADIKSPVYPKPQQELADSIAYIRDNAQRLNTNPDMLAVMGFSAGAHLAGSIGCLWKRYGKASRPNALVLCYPVISSGEFAHKGSFDNLCGTDETLRAQLSLENQVSSETPPTFLWHTKTDDCVPVQNSILFKAALDKFGIPSELRLFETGHHGLSLATDEVSKVTHRTVNEEVQIWPELVRSWLLGLFGQDWY